MTRILLWIFNFLFELSSDIKLGLCLGKNMGKIFSNLTLIEVVVVILAQVVEVVLLVITKMISFLGTLSMMAWALIIVPRDAPSF